MKIITCVFVLLLGFVNKFMFLLNNFYVFYAVTIWWDNKYIWITKQEKGVGGIINILN